MMYSSLLLLYTTKAGSTIWSFYCLRSEYNSFQFSATLILTLVLMLAYYSSEIWYAYFCRNSFLNIHFMQTTLGTMERSFVSKELNPELITAGGKGYKSSVILKNNFVSIVEPIKNPNVQSHPSSGKL